MAGTLKTRKMRKIERNFNKPIRKIITQLTFEHGMSGAAQKMGISESGLQNYIKRLNMHIETVVYHKTDRVYVVTSQNNRYDPVNPFVTQNVA